MCHQAAAWGCGGWLTECGCRPAEEALENMGAECWGSMSPRMSCLAVRPEAIAFFWVFNTKVSWAEGPTCLLPRCERRGTLSRIDCLLLKYEGKQPKAKGEWKGPGDADTNLIYGKLRKPSSCCWERKAPQKARTASKKSSKAKGKGKGKGKPMKDAQAIWAVPVLEIVLRVGQRKAESSSYFMLLASFLESQKS